MSISELQRTVQDKDACQTLAQYRSACDEILEIFTEDGLTRIVSPTTPSYIFFQYSDAFKHQITRPINTTLFLENPRAFTTAYENVERILHELGRQHEDKHQALVARGLDPLDIDRVVYTMQQSLGSIADSFDNPNQGRKRVGQLFENLITIMINMVGVACEPRTVNIPLPDHPERRMSYQLDLVFSRGRAIVTAERPIAAEDDVDAPQAVELISRDEIVGSVKTTSKDRIDKVFLDKFLLSRLLGRDIPVVAIFLHDVQRAKKAGNIFGINSTFKSNHFLGYTLALNRLDGVYYVDPRPAMADGLLAEEIGQFSRFLTRDLWAFGTV